MKLAFTSLLVVAIAASVCFLGCRRTVKGGYIDSPDNKYRMYGRVYGAYGRSFPAATSKTIRISIVSTGNETLLIRKEYQLVGSDISWNAAWDNQDNLTVVIYDFGPGISYYDVKDHASPTNYIRTLFYHLDGKAGIFRDANESK